MKVYEDIVKELDDEKNKKDEKTNPLSQNIFDFYGLPLGSNAFYVMKYDVFLEKVKGYLNEEEIIELNKLAKINYGKYITINLLMDFFLIYDDKLYSSFSTYEFEDNSLFLQCFLKLLSCRRMNMEIAREMPTLKYKTFLGIEKNISLFELAQQIHVPYNIAVDIYENFIKDINLNIDLENAFIGNMIIDQYESQIKQVELFRNFSFVIDLNKYVYIEENTSDVLSFYKSLIEMKPAICLEIAECLRFDGNYKFESLKKFAALLLTNITGNETKQIMMEEDYEFIDNLMNEYVTSYKEIDEANMENLLSISRNKISSRDFNNKIFELALNDEKENNKCKK